MIQLSCATICTEGFGDTDFARTFEMMPAAGYRFIEFNLWHPSMMMPRTLDSLRERMQARQMQASSVHAISLGTAEELTREVSHKLWMAQIAQKLGCRMLSATGCGRGKNGGVEQIIKIVQQLVPYLEDNGLELSLENHQGNNLEFIEDYQKIFDAVPSKSVGCCVDTGHFEASGVKLDDVLSKLGPRINHVHLKENKTFGTKQFTRFGEGSTDHHRLLKQLAEMKYNGFAVIEISPPADRPVTVDDLHKPVEMFDGLVSLS